MPPSPPPVRTTSRAAPYKASLAAHQPVEEEYKDICSICLDGLDVVDEYGIFSVPSCGHNFHMSCLYEVCTTDGLNDLCPLCRDPIPCDKIESMKEYVPLLIRIEKFIGGPWMPAPVLVQGNEPTHWRIPPEHLLHDAPYTQVFNALASEADDLKIPLKCENYTHNNILELKRSIEILYFSVFNNKRLKNQDGLFPQDSWLVNQSNYVPIDPNKQGVLDAIGRLKTTLETIIQENNPRRGPFNLFEHRTRLCMDTFFRGLTRIYIKSHPRTDLLVGTVTESPHWSRTMGGSKKRNKKNKKTKKYKKKYKSKRKINRTKKKRKIR
jgi:hypothetical protein